MKALSETVQKLKNNHEYFWAVVSGYGFMGSNILVQILLVPIYISALGKYKFGVLMVLLAFINYAILGIGWMSGGLTRMLGECAAKNRSEDFGKIYSLSKWIFAGYALIVGLVMIGVVQLLGDRIFDGYEKIDRETVVWGVVCAAAYFVALYELNVDRTALTALKRQTAGNLVQLLSLLIFAFVAVSWLYQGGGLEVVLIGLLIGTLAARAAVWLHWKFKGPRLKWSLPSRDGLPFFKRLTGPMGMGYLLFGCFNLTLAADTILIGWLGGAEMAAEFVLVWKIAEVLIMIIDKVPGYLQPYIIHADVNQEGNRLQRIIPKFWKGILAVSLAAALAYALLGPWIVGVWVGLENRPDEPLAYLLAAGAIFWLGCSRLPISFAYSTVKLKALNQVSGVELAAKLVIILILFPKVGYLAPLIAINAIHAVWAFRAYRNMMDDKISP